LCTERGGSELISITARPTRRVAAVVASEAVEHKKGPLIPALTDSCAPIIFRSFASLAGSHHVDGGLCDNLGRLKSYCPTLRRRFLPSIP
jgi:hypothetical protein